MRKAARKPLDPCLDGFLARGIGYVVLADSAIVSPCIAAFVSGQQFEFGPPTYEPYRHRGCSTAVVAACLKRDREPVWRC
jgi:hypothetical protein